MNCLRPSTVIPLLRTPLTVGKRGSSLSKEYSSASKRQQKVSRKKSSFQTHHPSTYPCSTNQVSFLLDSTVLLRLSLAYSQMYGFLMPRASMNQ